MDKTKIKNFAIDARRQLIEEITLKARLIGIKKDGIQEPTNETNEIQFFGEYSISGEDIQRRQKLVTELKKRSTGKKLEEVLPVFIEEIAYTWFNRLIAIRFMEVNRYLPSRIRVLSSETPGQNQPDIITEAFNSDLKFNATETEQIKFALLNQTVDVMNDLYKMIFIKQANKLNDVLPQLFEKIADYSELLFTPNYTDVNGVIHKLVNDIDEADFDVNKSGQVEIIGWLYQYYNTEPKDYVIGLPKSIKYVDSQIAQATQIFTPDWIVQYMVENSLGKYWIKVIQAKGDNRVEEDIAKSFGWKYYMADAEQSENVRVQLNTVNRSLADTTIEDLEIIDPSMGSGHILVYAFDVLMSIYESEGYSSQSAAKSIIEKNLHGLDIDNRAFQLSYFAIMMKYRQYSRRAFQSQSLLSVFDIPSTQTYKMADLNYLSNWFSEPVISDINKLITLFHNGDDLGSLIKIENINLSAIQTEVDRLKGQLTFDLIPLVETVNQLLSVGKLLSQQYQIVITNPPYMGSSRMNTTLAKFAKNQYPNSKSDLFAMFIERWNQSLTLGGFNSMVTMQSWMFLSSFEAMRTHLLDSYTISNLMHMENNVMGIAFGTAVTITRNMYIPEFNGTYHQIKTADATNTIPTSVPIKGNRFNRTNQANFKKIPGSPIAYWASMSILSDFDRGTILGDIAKSIHGSVTGNNNYFLKQWYEVTYINIYFTAEKSNDQIFKNINWVPYNKGGNFRKWYGNYDFVLKWKNFGEEVTLKGDMRNPSYYFKPSLTWSLITSGNFAARFRTKGSIHDAAGASAYFESENSLLYVMGLLNTPVGNHIFKILNPTINLSNGVVLNFPTLCADSDVSEYVIILVKSQITIAKKDWDSFETSWDFTQHPLLSQIDEHNRNWTVEAAYESWADEAQTRFDQLKANEEELNRIFIDLYGLQDELTPEVEDKDVSVRRADQNRDIKSLLSYFIGLVFGRYSLDVDGLAFAGGEFDKSKYTTFIPNTDDVVMLTDADYFGDERDIIYRFKEFLAVTFGEDNLLQNLSFIADVLGGKGKPEEVIRNYFFKDFFKDHVQIYKKRPIYWQLESGKLGGFKALIYLHRYDENTMAMIRTNYLNELQNAYEARLSTLTNLIDNATDTKSKSGYEKQRVKLTNQLDELVIFEDKVAYLANRHVALDLDDGVVENYKKVQSDEDGNLLNVFSKLK
ncbi:BREX-1 system adenine-specific DNA-methyltransferase PglX [Leuconostoc citreum]|uniref:BREX-1 system adenine-specific DNA-methyltransferase PglX n=1 Tax=Leuconostoc citreum TaxID=33964 RepID=UPI0021A6E3A7|nr:BREX-1 system adenine-specific DNA-methyltransferase PglX [Leuconostoc citreum]MCT3058330.1 BREX-1 system adenine-specific DNA-methyltransferase PglX [Leuconostoc citreum]MDM7641242.1 BREX-1 system adenine-specific DNA-methyltransferase PglX [Leuconostoc citreum]